MFIGNFISIELESLYNIEKSILASYSDSQGVGWESKAVSIRTIVIDSTVYLLYRS
jgi:hypothetical protein